MPLLYQNDVSLGIELATKLIHFSMTSELHDYSNLHYE